MKLSVCMITYNHENYIREAIEGVVMQQTNFDFELVIGEDCSTDNTRVICLEYQRQYPEKIKLLLPSKNLGMMPNFIATLQACQGKYIALCDGDDYWIDPFKLQKQVDFLENNPDYIIHSGNAIYKSNDSRNGEKCISILNNNSFTTEDFYFRNNLLTCTVVFRNNPRLFSTLENYKLSFADWFLYFLLTQNSGQKAYRCSDIFSVYRIHQQGVYSNLDSYDIQLKKIIHTTFIFKFIRDYNKSDFRNFINRQFAYLYEICIGKASFNMFIKTVKYQYSTLGSYSIIISLLLISLKKLKYISKKQW